MAYLLASHRQHVWTLPPAIHMDYFSLQKEGSGALLLIGMHVTDERPWTCARNAVQLLEPPGLIDREAKRILGKRYQLHNTLPAAAVVIDPIQRVTDFLEAAGPAPTEKTPGRLLARKLTAKAEVVLSNESFTLETRNYSELSQCLHAELTLLLHLSRRLAAAAPERIEALHLQTTLKPCKMCAAFLHVARQRCSKFSVRYDEHDPGRLAADTLLDRYGYES